MPPEITAHYTAGALLNVNRN